MKRMLIIDNVDVSLLRSLLQQERDVAISRRMLYERLQRTVDDHSFSNAISGYYHLMKRCNRLLEIFKPLAQEE